MKRLASLVFVTACTYSNPPPQPYHPQPAPPPEPAQPAVAAQPAPPPPEAAPAESLPIDPDKEMPKGSLTTDANLALGAEASVMIDARSDVYSAGATKADPKRGGVMPSTITLAPGGGIITFPKVVGRAACNASARTDADGGSCAGGNTDLNSAGALSGIKHHQRTMFLVGVFLGPKLPNKAPPILDFSDDKLGTKFQKLEPQLGQVFYIGDGHPAEPSGPTHDFVVPNGATRLFLGYADGFAFQGAPGYYDDNKGGLSVTVLQRK